MGFSEKNDAIFEFQTIAHPLWSFGILQGYSGQIELHMYDPREWRNFCISKT